MAQYKDGLINVVNGSDVVTGIGTLWLGNIAVNNLLTINGVAYTIDSNTTNTNLTLTGNYNGPTLSNQVYGISVDETAGGIPLLSAGDLNTAAIYNEAMKNIDNQNQLLGTAAFTDLTSPGATIWDDGNLKPFTSQGIGKERIAQNQTGGVTNDQSTVSGASLGNSFADASGAWINNGNLTGIWRCTQGFNVPNLTFALYTRVS